MVTLDKQLVPLTNSAFLNDDFITDTHALDRGDSLMVQLRTNGGTWYVTARAVRALCHLIVLPMEMRACPQGGTCAPIPIQGGGGMICVKCGVRM